MQDPPLSALDRESNLQVGAQFDEFAVLGATFKVLNAHAFDLVDGCVDPICALLNGTLDRLLRTGCVFDEFVTGLMLLRDIG